MIKDLRENIEKTANVKAVFGDEKKLNGISIIPIASIRMKGGGCGGTGTTGNSEEKSSSTSESDEEKNDSKIPSTKGKGGGGGLDVEANPVGYIEVKEGNTRFVEILDKSKMILKGIKILGVVIILSAIKRFLSRKKKK